MLKQKQKIKNLLWYLYVPIFIIVIGIFLFPKSAYLSTITREKLIELTNKTRQENNLPILRVNEKLNKAASNKAKDILKYNKFAHNFNNRRFSQWIKDVNYDYYIVGENLAIDFADSESIMKAWLNSPSHRKNILSKQYTEIGMSVQKGNYKGNPTIVVAQLFGRPSKQELSSMALLEANSKKYNLEIKKQKLNTSPALVIANIQNKSGNNLTTKNPLLREIDKFLNIKQFILIYTAQIFLLIYLIACIIYNSVKNNLYQKQNFSRIQ